MPLVGTDCFGVWPCWRHTFDNKVGIITTLNFQCNDKDAVTQYGAISAGISMGYAKR